MISYNWHRLGWLVDCATQDMRAMLAVISLRSNVIFKTDINSLQPRKETRQSLTRLRQRARRLHEQGADRNRLRQYVQRWYDWLHAGLRNRVSTQGRFTPGLANCFTRPQIPERSICPTITATGGCLAGFVLLIASYRPALVPVPSPLRVIVFANFL